MNRLTSSAFQQRQELQDRALALSRLVVKGKNLREAAEEMGISYEQARRSARLARSIFKAEITKNEGKRVARELAKYDTALDELWAAWDKSKTEKRPEGDAATMGNILKCLNQRSRLLGLYEKGKEDEKEQSQLTLLVVDTREQVGEVMGWEHYKRLAAPSAPEGDDDDHTSYFPAPAEDGGDVVDPAE